MCFFYLLLLSLLLVACSIQASELTNDRTLKEDSVVTCHILEQVMKYDDGHQVKTFMCFPFTEDGTRMDISFPLEEGIVKGHEAKVLDGDAYATLSPAHLLLDSETGETTELVTTKDAKLTFLDRVPDNHRNLAVTSIGQDQKVLVVRLGLRNNVNVGFSRSTLADRIFGSGVTLSSVYEGCSFGKLKFKPASGNGISNGVADVYLDKSVNGLELSSIINELTTMVTNKWGNKDSTNVYDHVMFCIPPGTGTWSAGAYIGGYRSFYNDARCGSVSHVVHEIGHNLGLNHAGVESAVGNFRDYEDQSGYMGFSYDRTGFPSMCFNGQKNSKLGWYEGKAKEVNPGTRWGGILAAFADYPAVPSGQYVLIRVGEDHHIQYNRKKGINIQTQEAEDDVTIVRGQGSEVSYRVASLGSPNSQYVIPNSNTVVKLCEKGKFGSVDFTRISIHPANKSDTCNDNISNAPPTSTTFSDCTADSKTCFSPSECCSNKCSARNSPDGVTKFCLPSDNSNLGGSERHRPRGGGDCVGGAGNGCVRGRSLRGSN